jgi:hypothetical protein
MNAKHYAILRAQKYRLGNSLDLVGNHNERTHTPTHADPLRADQNIILVGSGTDTFSKRVKAHLQSHGITKTRSNAIHAIEYLFQPGDASWQGDLMQWVQDTMQWINDQHGSAHVFSAVLHRDERTPHIHAFVVPLYQGRLCASHWLDGPAKLAEMQTRYAQAVSHHGLSRGENGSRRKHIAASELRENSHVIEDLLKAAVETLPSKNFAESTDKHGKRIAEHLTQTLAPVVSAARSGLMAKKAEHLAAIAERKARKERALRLDTENQMKTLLREQSDRIREIPVIDVLTRILGVEARNEGASLIIETDSRKYVVTGQKFKEFKTGRKGGGGAIDAAMSALDCDYREALRWLSDAFPTADLTGSVRANAEKAIARVIQQAKEQPISIEEKLAKFASRSDETWPKAETYLTAQRGLPEDLIRSLYQSGDIWSNKQGSVVFAHRSAINGKIVGATIRGTDDPARKAAGQAPWKQSIGNKGDGFFRIGDGNRFVAICESPIDAIALYQVQQLQPQLLSGSGIFASTAGAGGDAPILHFAQRQSLQVYAAQDAEEAGDKQSAQTISLAAQLRLVCQRLRPPVGKDLADFLQFIKSQIITLKLGSRHQTTHLEQNHNTAIKI